MKLTSNRKSNRKLFLALGLIVLIVLVAVFQFNQFKLFPWTVVSVSQIEVQPGGYEDPSTKEWKGTFWLVTCTADMDDQITLKTVLPKGTTATTSTGETITSQSDIKINFKPETPYYLRQMAAASRSITPTIYSWYYRWNWLGDPDARWQAETFSNGTSVPAALAPFDTGHFEWVSGSRWEKYTPFTIEVYRNTTQVGSTLSFNTEGGARQADISTSEGTMHFVNLGMLAGRFGEPGFGEIAWFSDNYIYGIDSYARGLMTNPYPSSGEGDLTTESYATYFYGTDYTYDAATQTCTPWPDWYQQPDYDVHPSGTGFTYHPGYVPDDYNDADQVWSPIPMGKFPSDKKTYAYGKHDGTWYSLTPGEYLSLTEYLENKGVSKISTNLYSSVTKRSDNKLQVNMPFNALNEGSPIFTILIPTELADTIVWTPQVANVKISASNIPTEVATQTTGTLTFHQYSDATSTAFVTITQNPSTLSITPSSFQVSLAPGAETTQSLTIINPYSDQERSITITVTVTNNLGTVTDSKTYQIKQLVRTGATSILHVDVFDDTLSSSGPEGSAGKRVDGIFVTATSSGNPPAIQKSGYSGSAGTGAIEWDLGTFQGANVIIASAETSTYYASNVTKLISSGMNTVELHLLRKDTPTTNIPIVWFVVLGIVCASAVGFMVYRNKQPKRRK